MPRAYAGDALRPLAGERGSCPAAPPRRRRRVKGEHDKELYRRRKEGERFFGRRKRFRRIFTRYDQWDPMYLGFVLLAGSFELPRRLFQCEQALAHCDLAVNNSGNYALYTQVPREAENPENNRILFHIPLYCRIFVM